MAGRSGGFTLVELVVVMAIATVIMTALVIQQSKWNDSLAVSTQAYEMALMVRQAQAYALGVRENIAGAGDKFDVAYGIYFDSFNQSEYKFFADKDRDGLYNEATDQIIESKYLTRNVLMTRFCGIKGVGNEQERCSPGIGNVAYMHITFYRPKPEASVIMRNSGGGPALNVEPPGIIYLMSPGGICFFVKTETNGQISTGQAEGLECNPS